MEHDIKSIFSGEPCPEDREEMVIALAEGVLDEEEKEAVIGHLAGCASCRSLLHDYDTAGSEDQADYRSVPLECILSGTVLKPLQGWRYADASVQVMDGDSAPQLVYDVKTAGEAVKIYILKTSRGITLLTRMVDRVTRLYLFGEGKTYTSVSETGAIEIMGIEPGNYLLSLDLKNFIEISITQE